LLRAGEKGRPFSSSRKKKNARERKDEIKDRTSAKKRGGKRKGSLSSLIVLENTSS